MPADHLPLLRTSSLDAPVAIYRGAPVSARQFIAQADALAAAFPEARYVVNLCENRYHFALAWAAACLRSQVTLLPPNRARGVLEELSTTYARQHTVDDDRIAA